MSATPLSDFCPYKGLQPYTEEDRKYFFGREQDQAVIASNLFAAPVTVLYGASGVGKSSVLLAGVVPQLKEDPQVAVVVFRTWQGRTFQTALKSEVLRALSTLQALRKINDPITIDVRLPFDEFLLACDKVLPFRGRILFVFDQFEEYFLNPPNGQDGDFDAELARAINRREIPVNVLFSMRDDGLSKLDRFQGRIPNLLGNLLRVEHLTLKDARRAIEKPLLVYNVGLPAEQQVTIENSLIDALLDRAQPEDKQEKNTTKQPAVINAVETPVLQILLTRLWKEERALSSSVLRLDTFEQRLGGAEHIIFTYLKDVMDSLEDSDQEIAAGVFQFLTTPAKTKIAHEPRSLASWAKLDASRVQQVLDRLSAREDKILRKVQVSGQPIRYEIFHDVLGGPLAAWRDHYLHDRETEEAQRRAADAAEEKAKRAFFEAQLRLAELRSRSNARLRKVIWALGVMFFLAMATAMYALKQKSEAGISAETARLAYLKAAENEQLVIAALRSTELERDRAAKNADEANLQRGIAEVNAQEAKRQAELVSKKESLARVETVRANMEAKRAVMALQEASFRLRANELYREGTDLFLSGQYREAIGKLTQTLSLFAASNDSRERAKTLLTIGRANDLLAEKRKALENYQEALMLFQRSGDSSGVARAKNALGDLYISFGETHRAVDLLTQALAFYQESENVAQQAVTMNNLAALYTALGDYETSLKILNQAVILNRQIGNKRGEADTLINVGRLFLSQGRKEEALLHSTYALNIYQKINNRFGEGQALRRIGEIYDALGDKDKAKEFYQRASAALRID